MWTVLPPCATRLTNKEMAIQFGLYASLLVSLACCRTLYFQPQPAGVVTCANSSQTCPSGGTCCPLEDNVFACCNLNKAVCCPDKVHCCPEDYRCDVTTNTCVKDERSRSQALLKSISHADHKVLPAHKTNFLPKKALSQPLKGTHHIKGVASGSIMCKDNRTYCQDDCTCCMMACGHWGCCPLPDAVCCSDGVHCCPHGFWCDLQHQACRSNSTLQPLVIKVKGVRQEGTKKSHTECSDGRKCAASDTCCGGSKAISTCCPADGATCCPDGRHCCPRGSNCDVTSGTCHGNGLTVPWLEHARRNARGPRNEVQQREEQKKQTMGQEETVDAGPWGLMCPDHHLMCNDTCTCCLTITGSWGCCPLENAVCCVDHIHCCPDGYECDLKNMRCSGPFSSLPWNTFIHARRRHPNSHVVRDTEERRHVAKETDFVTKVGEYGTYHVAMKANTEPQRDHNGG